MYNEIRNFMEGGIIMNNTTKKLARSALLLAIAIVFQIIGRNLQVASINQFLVGPIINAILLVSVVICGTWWGVGIGVLTPILAFLIGQLSPIFAPFIPFIMIGNILYVIAFALIYKKFKTSSLAKEAIGVIISSLLKFAFMFVSAVKIIHILNISFSKLALKLLPTAMGMLQLVTAIIGGILAIVIIEILRKRKQILD